MMTRFDDYLPVNNGVITLPEALWSSWAGKTVPWALTAEGELSIYSPERISAIMSLPEEELAAMLCIAVGTLYIKADGRVKLPDAALPMLQGHEVYFIGRLSFNKLIICTDVEAERRAEAQIISEDAIREALQELDI